ncbi:MAG: hypothetical protein DI598_12000 [Pseudopedobacter saltans]|uniref:Helix-turn-helix domain-containing protein n=1 Tax=Pseudopedobacter saltans TaxID=151895 RepID=A0A2W5GTC4_9SPHI|nr:MAG: hypothetical protein DI598_12000 [Pseudopedobacter saltans]
MEQKMILTTYSESDLAKFFFDCFKLIRKDLLADLTTNTSIQSVNKTKRHLTRREAANYLRMSLPMLNKKTKEGAIKSVASGGKVLYLETELDSFLQAREFV